MVRNVDKSYGRVCTDYAYLGESATSTDLKTDRYNSREIFLGVIDKLMQLSSYG